MRVSGAPRPEASSGSTLDLQSLTCVSGAPNPVCVFEELICNAYIIDRMEAEYN